VTDQHDNSAKEITQQPPPGTLRSAVAVWVALAAFGLLTAGATWAGRSQLRQALLNKGLVPPDKVDATLQALLVRNTLVFALFAAVYVALGLLLYKGKTWARLALSLVAALQLLVLLSSGVSVAVALLFGLIISALVLSWLPASSRWLADIRAEG
jgi:hypothetical protein